MITSGAIKFELEDGRTITIRCHRHYHAFMVLKDLGLRYKKADQGFIVRVEEEDRFVDRKEAMFWARSAEQVGYLTIHPEELFTEDLW